MHTFSMNVMLIYSLFICLFIDYVYVLLNCFVLYIKTCTKIKLKMKTLVTPHTNIILSEIN